MKSNKAKLIFIIAAVLLVLIIVAVIFALTREKPCEHTETVSVPAIAPTCTETGLTEGKQCSACGITVIEQTTVPVIDHSYVDFVCTMCGKVEDIDYASYLIFKELDDGTYSVRAKDKELPPHFIIPATHEGKAVTVIANEGFYSCDKLISMTIPENVTEIGSEAFRLCANLETVSFPSTLQYIRWGAFTYCKSLTSVTFPEGFLMVERDAFEECRALTEIRFNATAAADLEFENSVFCRAGIDGEGIRITVGANVTRIPAAFFYSHFGSYNGSADSPKITELVFEEGSVCEKIGSHAFFDAHHLTAVKLPDSVTHVARAAFSACKSITELDLGGGIRIIDNSAFQGCYNLEKLTIPKQVEKIYPLAFISCDKISEIYFDAVDCWVSDSDGGACIFPNVGSKTDGITVTIGKNVKKIPTALFRTLKEFGATPKIITVRFEKDTSCETIGSYAFEGCTRLTDVYYPGTEEDWGKITVYENNDPLTNATMHFE